MCMIGTMRTIETKRLICVSNMPNLNIGNVGEHSVSAIRKTAEFHGLVEEVDWKERGPEGPDYVFNDGLGRRYVAEAKVVRDGRTDRVISQLCVAIVEASHHAKHFSEGKPLAIVYVSNVTPSMLRQVKEFADKYTDETGVAIVTEDGASLMKLSGVWRQHKTMERMLHEVRQKKFLGQGTTNATPFNPFSDLSQWMLKVLLAAEVSPEMLSAPRDPIYSGADLARAAGVSPMSANRLLQYLKRERYLIDGNSGITLARREDFFSLWRSASMTPPAEIGMRFRARVAMNEQLAALLSALGDKACLGLFSAADRLGMGHVSGVPPYIYMPKLPALEARRPEWQMIDVCKDGQVPDFFVRRAKAPISTFRGAVQRDGQLCTDVIQVWLDVVNHPSRGAEQAEHIYRTVLRPIVEAH